MKNSLEPGQTTVLRRILIETVEQSTPQTASPNTRRRRERHPVRLAALIAVPLVAAVAITTAVVWPGADSANAAEALRSAADTTIETSDPFVGPGQYLKVTTEAAYLAYESDADGHMSAYLSPSTTEVFIPADADREWVQRITAEPAAVFYGDESRAAAQRDWAETLRGGIVRETRDLNGRFAGSVELGGGIAESALPDSPEQTLALLREGPYGDGTDSGALSYAAQLLREGTMLASQRSVLYRALALIPGIRITDGNAVLDGRTGIAFSLDVDTRTPEIIVDPITGLFIGERTLTTTDTGAVPAGVEEEYTAVSTTVVDQAP